MRIESKHAVITEMGQGRIMIFGDDGVELVRIQSWIFKRLSTFGCADLFGILMAMDIDEVTREDLHWWIKNCSINDFINEWTICLNKDDDIHYKYVATITNFEYVEL